MFQQLVYTYGVPKYKEINPTGFTIVTYPFFFAVMFGDIAHGICLVAIGLSILISRKYSPKVLN
jgi:V-type H+-transporting ATPase subunit a